MADEKKQDNRESVYAMLCGRLPIYTTIERFDPEDTASIISEVNEALSIHAENVMAEDYLYWYRRGYTPIQNRQKTIRPEINNKINVNYATEIVDFKNGYFLTAPSFYIARESARDTEKIDSGEVKDDIADKVKMLNEYLYRSGKQQVDNKTVDWFHTVGKADIFVKANDDKDKPFVVYSLDPRSALVARSLDPSNRPVYGLYVVSRNGQQIVSLWDDTHVFTLTGAKTGKFATPTPEYLTTVNAVIDVQPNPLGQVPIIEYHYNSVNMSAFEAAVPLLDAVSYLQSDRLDAVDQAVQSLLVFYNCELEDDNGSEITPRMVRDAGALFLKSVGENKADLKEIVTNLDQSQTQIFIDNLREQILSICSMPFARESGYHNAATGNAALIMNGWYQADTSARNTQDLFIESNAVFDEIILKILRDKNILDLKTTDITLDFPKNETVNIQAKAQAFQTLLACGLQPQLAASKSGISNDPISDIKLSEPWLKMIWGDPFAPKDALDEVAPEPAAPFAPNSANEPDTPAGQKSRGFTEQTVNSAANDNVKGTVGTYTQMRNGRKIQISGYVRKTKGSQVEVKE
jgi:SPP1 family phage portal protein